LIICDYKKSEIKTRIYFGEIIYPRIKFPYLFNGAELPQNQRCVEAFIGVVET
jgi:hypothetical protein